MVRRLGIEINGRHQANVATVLTNSLETPVPLRFPDDHPVDVSGREWTALDRIRGTSLAPETIYCGGGQGLVRAAQMLRPKHSDERPCRQGQS